ECLNGGKALDGGGEEVLDRQGRKEVTESEGASERQPTNGEQSWEIGGSGSSSTARRDGWATVSTWCAPCSPSRSRAEWSSPTATASCRTSCSSAATRRSCAAWPRRTV